MKQNVTQFEEKNEPVNFWYSVLGNYFLELEPGNYQAKEVSHESDMQFYLLQFSWTDEVDCNIVNLVTNLVDATNQIYLEDRFWILYFDGSKTQEGSRVGCVLIDPEKNWHFISCRLDFECTNNTTEYEALVQGLKKSHWIKCKKFESFWWFWDNC